MSLLQALLLGIVQGLTEFFPVSSSAHLKLTRYWMGLPEGEQWLYFDLLCHAGTWLALVFFLRRDIWAVLKDPRKIALFSLALAPLIPAYFLLKPLRVALSAPAFTGYFLLATAALLFLASKKKIPAPVAATPSREWPSVLCIGVMQALALLPGVSRSGSTIAGAKFCGWSWIDGARFSFLLAVPTILGGEVLESYRLVREAAAPTPYCLVGFLSAFAVGLVAVRFVFRIYERGAVKPFAWYCVGMGLLMMRVFHG